MDGLMIKAFINADAGTVAAKLTELNDHFGFPSGGTLTYSKTFIIEADGHADNGKSGIMVKTSGWLDASSVISGDELVERDNEWFPEPVEEPEDG